LSLLDGSKSNEDETVPLRGYYLDSEVKGVNYDCGKYNGKTANDGLFLFEKGEGCSFKLGETVIRDVKPDELFNGITIIEDNINVARVLQTMDIDNNPENGIDIEEEAVKCIKDTLPKNEDEFDNLVECLNSANIPDFVNRDYAVTEDEARDHIENTKESLIPEAKNINLSVVKDGAVEINLIAENPRSDMLSYKVIEQPKNGKLEGEAPHLVYYPNSGFAGNDSFTYIASNRRFSSNIAKVNIEVKDETIVSSINEQVKTLEPQEDDKSENSSLITINPEDNVVVYKTSLVSSNSDLKRDNIAKITKELYNKFRDDFDFIFIISNSTRKEFNYSGLYFSIKNDTKGLGKEMFDYSEAYGSDGRLQGVIHFPSIDKFDNGPKLHEILHRWANSIIDWRINDQISHHWGYNGLDKRGQLGGFEIDTLEIESGSFEEGGIFSANLFGTNANGGDAIPYNKIELYLMGLIPADEVGDIMLTEDASYIKTEAGRTFFKASKVERVPFTEYLERRDIELREKTKRSSFKVLTVLLTNSTPSDDKVEKVSEVISNFAKYGSDDLDYSYNLYEATNGKLHLNIDNVSDSLK